ncbi:dual specificity protein phosphatase 23-like [Mytilus californianus]|uniref:dual specificity protein phosphatase 23-like n=1 Tax=Mytilus californianus TaxID=6549 RepID=UPI002246366B|nr:dual specificity protein phosphatase 23-like [Mytilus californianus]
MTIVRKENGRMEQHILLGEMDHSQIPPNFSWVVDGKLCAMGFPRSKEHIQYLLDNNVTYLISLTSYRQPPVTDFKDMNHLHCKVEEFTPPSLDQIQESIDFIDRAYEHGKAVGIHCQHGIGRTGTVVACYFVEKHSMTAVEAISHIRSLRRWSIETTEQEQTVYQYDKRNRFLFPKLEPQEGI